MATQKLDHRVASSCYSYSRVLQSRFWRLCENQPQSSSFGACKISSHKKPDMGGQLPNYIFYWEFRDFSINDRPVLILNIDWDTKLLTNFEKD